MAGTEAHATVNDLTQQQQLEDAKVIAQSLSAASPCMGASRSAATKTYRCQVFGVGAVREPPVRLGANPQVRKNTRTFSFSNP
jgi:hypothetical protein